MQLNEAIALIETPAIQITATTQWADLGCGTGMFTKALAHYLQPGSTIHAVDKSSSLIKAMQENDVYIKPLQRDFINDELGFNNLDGILMANALHYVADKIIFINKLKTMLQPGGRLLIVEYDTDVAVPVWVPYPVSFHSLKKLFSAHGFAQCSRLHEVPSIYGRGQMYAALLRQVKK